MNKAIQEEVWDKKIIIYQDSLRIIADDFVQGKLNFREFESSKKKLMKDIFGEMENPYLED